MDNVINDLREKYKPNSQKSKIEQEEINESKKKPHKITKDPVRIRKKSPGKKFLESFIAEDVANIKDYIIYDVLLPAFKNTVVDAVTNSIQMILWGDTKRPSNSFKNGGRTYINYGGYSSALNNQRQVNNVLRARHDFDDIIFDSRGEAEEVLSQLVDFANDYGSAAVSDLYAMVGIQSGPIDQKWGWKDLSSASVARVRDGYLLKLPKTISIN